MTSICNTMAKSYTTPLGELLITVIGHASLYLQIKGLNIFVDPWSKQGDYTKFPKADLVRY
jgi:L-ascorbate metabolism protein UlaG (beta-lactamase superfamily)